MIRAATKLRFEADANAMRKAVRKEFDATCIATGCTNTYGMLTVCTAHFFPASTFPSVKSCLENGLPFVAMLHNYEIIKDARILFIDGSTRLHSEIGCMDKTPSGVNRDPVERLEWMVDTLPAQTLGIAFPRLKFLVSEAREFDREIAAMSSELLDILEGIE